jgi:hypothetical protein
MLPSEHAMPELMALRAQIAGDRLLLTAIRLGLLVRKANFNPGQLRIPAGQVGGGRWTDGGGGEKPIRVAEGDRKRKYSVDLNEEEARGGHTKERHAGKTDDYLLARVSRDRYRFLGVTIYRWRAGTFLSLESANDFVNRTLEENQAMVDAVASGQRDRAFLKKRFGYVTGTEAFRLDANSDPYMRNTYEVGVDHA